MAIEEPPVEMGANAVLEFLSDRCASDELRDALYDFVDHALYSDEELKMVDVPSRTLFLTIQVEVGVNGDTKLLTEGYILTAQRVANTELAKIKDQLRHCRFLVVVDGKITDIGNAVIDENEVS